jgi:glycerol kinase
MSFLLAIDQGTTSSRAILYSAALKPLASAQAEFPQIFPHSGWVEHDPQAIWNSVLACTKQAISGIDARQIAAIGITNQRETTIVWDKVTGLPLHNAIVWQDRRTADFCNALRESGHEPMITARTGLLLDPYFSGTKLKYILDLVPNARQRAARGEIAFGTVDTFLIWHLTGGRVHATDATNAARTMLYDIGAGKWDKDICELLDIPMQILPSVLNSADDFGATDPAILGAAIPIRGVAGDQQAATVGQACFEPGMMKSTYGTGCFALMNTGTVRAHSNSKLLTTIAYQFNGKPTYALEGSIFIAGAVVQWLRDGLKIITAASETQGLADGADDSQDVLIVPAFTGLGAPYWAPSVRGAMFGITRATGPSEIARAALQSVGYQTLDLVAAMRADWPAPDGAVLRVDGGMVASDYTMQFLADIIGAPVDRPELTETTALGAAYLAGLGAGVCPEPVDFAKSWALQRRFSPQMGEADRAAKSARWGRAVQATLAV